MKQITATEQINAFFDEYENRFNRSLQGETTDLKAAAGSFTECFMESSPLGVICGKNDKDFEKKMEQGYAFYKSIGTTGMYITNRQMQVLDDFHTMCKVSWKYKAEKEGKQVDIDFMVIYLLQTMNDTVKIFAYITGDEQKALKDKGLL